MVFCPLDLMLARDPDSAYSRAVNTSLHYHLAQWHLSCLQYFGFGFPEICEFRADFSDALFCRLCI